MTNNAYGDSSLTAQNVHLEDSQFSYLILGNDSLEAGPGQVTPVGSVEGVIVTEKATGAKYTITSGDGNPLDVYSDENTVGDILGSTIKVKVEDPAADYTSVITYKDANGGPETLINAFKPLAPINSPGTTWERYNANNGLFWASETVWERGVGMKRTVYENGKAGLKAGTSGYKGYDKKHISYFDYYDDNALIKIESEYKLGSGIVEKTFSGDNLKIQGELVQDFSTLDVHYPDRSIWFASTSGSGVTGLYDYGVVNNVNDVALSTDGGGIPIYYSKTNLRISTDKNGNIVEVVNESGKTVKPKFDVYSVKFVDWNNAEISSQQVVSGENAVAPANPRRSGYTFKGWSGSYKRVTSDRIIAATYVKNSTKKANPISVAVKDARLNQTSEVQTINVSQIFTVKNAKGEVTYTKAKGSSKKLSISKDKVKVAKNAKGTLKLKVKIKAAGNKSYKSKTVTKTAYINVQ